MAALIANRWNRKLISWGTALIASPSRNWLDSHLGKSFHFAIHLFLLSLIAFAGWGLVTSLIPHRADSPDGHEAIAATRAAKVGVEQIIAAHLFGETAATKPVLATETPPADIKLVGILYSNDSKASRAILTVGGNAVMVHAGDTLADGTQVTGIEATRVLLMRDGATSALLLSFIGAVSGNASNPALQEADFQPGRSDAVSADASSIQNPATGAGSVLRTVDVPTSASPLEQMRSLRSQLVSGRPQRYLDKSQLISKPPSR
ncbi:MAG TPA: type II secretion system protein N [Gammaproteobacteria bacterium]|nr:type II secretion system protein N [Gammaproteobacteria bacterium]